VFYVLALIVVVVGVDVLVFGAFYFRFVKRP
jgi:hypothetical protein